MKISVCSRAPVNYHREFTYEVSKRDLWGESGSLASYPTPGSDSTTSYIHHTTTCVIVPHKSVMLARSQAVPKKRRTVLHAR